MGYETENKSFEHQNVLVQRLLIMNCGNKIPLTWQPRSDTQMQLLHHENTLPRTKLTLTTRDPPILFSSCFFLWGKKKKEVEASKPGLDLLD